MSKFFNDILQSDEFREEFFVAESQARLANLLDEKGISRAELARLLDVSRARITQIFSDDARNLTLRLLARSFLALGEEPTIVTKRELEVLRSKVGSLSKDGPPLRRRSDASRDVLTASMIADLLRASADHEFGEQEKGSRRKDSARQWAEEGSNVLPFRGAAHG